jgi:hypothetical protein
MYTFGGNGGLVDNYSNAVLVFPLPFHPKNKFQTLENLPGAPTPRSGHSAVVYKNEMYIFGGWNGHSSLDDFYSFNFETLTWKKIETESCASKRRMHSTVVYKDKLYLFGGFDESRPAQSMNELICYDFETKIWKTINCKGKIPKGRSRAGVTIVANNMYVVGGWDRVTHFEEILRLDLDTFVWYEEKTDMNLKVAQQTCVLVEDWLVMYGGKMNKDPKKSEMTASSDMIITRLSALPQERSSPGNASIQS